MADWYGNRYKEQYIFRRVAWGNFQEHERYDFITSGSIECSSDSELKVTGSFEFEGYELPNVSDLIRVYYRFTDDDGVQEEVAIATFLVSYASLTYTDTLKGIKAEGTLEGSSLLSVLEDQKIGVPMTIAKGANAVYEAQQLIRDGGLLTETQQSVYSLSADHTFGAGTSVLEMANWLLAAAGYTDAHPDENGVIQLKSYASAQQRTDAISFANNDSSIMYPQVEEQNDWQTTPNVVRLIYNTEDACIAASAENLSGSRASLDMRGGREITFFEEVSDLPQTSKAETMKEMAMQQLMELSCDVEYVKFAHAYIPLSIYDPVKIDYGKKEWSGNVDNMRIDLSTSTKTQTRIKRVLTENIQVRTSATVYRGG